MMRWHTCWLLGLLTCGVASTAVRAQSAPAAASAVDNEIIDGAFNGVSSRVERLCYNLTVDAEVYSPIFADRLKASLHSLLKDVLTQKNAQIQLSRQMFEMLRDKGIASAELEAYVLVNQQLKRDVEDMLLEVPTLVNETGPKIVLGLAKIKSLRERLVQDTALIDQTISLLVAQGHLMPTLMQRWHQISSALATDVSQIRHISETWLFCHQNILPDIKNEFQPFDTKRRYRHLVLMPSAKTLAGGIDLITTIAQVYARLATQDNATQSDWWKHMPRLQQMVALGSKDKLVKEWLDLMRDLRRSDRPILINNVIDWALAGDPLFNDQSYAANFLRLLALREQTQAQKNLVERLAAVNRAELRAELERERNKMLSLYSEYISLFMKISQEMAPVITKLNNIAGIKDTLVKATENVLAK